jgi:hypothetical protein
LILQNPLWYKKITEENETIQSKKENKTHLLKKTNSKERKNKIE